MTDLEMIERYQDIIRDAEIKIEEWLATSVKKHYGLQMRNSVLGRVGTILDSTRRKLEKLEAKLLIPDLTAKRIELLNRIYANVYSFLAHSTQYYGRTVLLNPQLLHEVAQAIDTVVTLPYSNGARHTIDDYMDAYMEGQVLEREKQQVLDYAKQHKYQFAYVSTNQTLNTCYICRFWMGRTGTIGCDVPGYVRLDTVVPLHLRCIHYLIPVEVLPHINHPDDWMLTATPKEYYRRFVETDDGRVLHRIAIKSSSQFRRSAREKHIENILKH